MLELESVHIPKTAGITFLNILRHWYGSDNVAAANMIAATAVSFTTTVMHGHFPAGTYRARKRITWVRDPARRLISHYFYLRFQHAPTSRTSPGFDLHMRLRAGQVSLDEFVHHPLMHRGVASWLNDLTLDDFDFVGIQEDFEHDLARCAHVLGRPPLSISGGDNVTVVPEYAAFKRQMDPALLDDIRELHAECTALYQEARARADSWWATHGHEVVMPAGSMQASVERLSA